MDMLKKFRGFASNFEKNIKKQTFLMILQNAINVQIKMNMSLNKPICMRTAYMCIFVCDSVHARICKRTSICTLGTHIQFLSLNI